MKTTKFRDFYEPPLSEQVDEDGIIHRFFEKQV